MKVTFLVGHMVKERDLILYELAHDLGIHGADVTIISGYPSRRISNEVREYYLDHPVEQISENVKSVRVGSKKGEGNGLFSRMLKYLGLSRAIVTEALKTETDVYYIYSTPPFLGYYSKKLSKVAPVLYNAQDLFPDSLKVATGCSERNLLIKLLRVFERRVYRHSNLIVTISNDMKKHIVSLGANKEKIKVIDNWADTTKIVSVEKLENKLFDEYGIDRDKFCVLYAGDIGYHQRLDVFVDVAKILNKKHDEIQFVFWGNGAYTEELKKTISDYGLGNFHIYPLQPIERISEVYSMGDIDIVSLEKGMTRLALPSKLWSVMSAGRPVLALLDKESDISERITSSFGISIDQLSPVEISDIIIDCADNRTKLEKMGYEARKLVCENNNREIQTKKYYEALVQLSRCRHE